MKRKTLLFCMFFLVSSLGTINAQKRDIKAVDVVKGHVALATAQSVSGAIDHCKEVADWINSSVTIFEDYYGRNAGMKVDFSTTWGDFKLIMEIKPDGSDGLIALYQNEEFISSDVAYSDFIESSPNSQLLIVFDTSSEFVAIYVDF